MTLKSNTNADEQTSSASTKKRAPTTGKAMTREELMKKLSTNPRFKEAGKPGNGFIIVGVTR
jgi:hypothetical protein